MCRVWHLPAYRLFMAVALPGARCTRHRGAQSQAAPQSAANCGRFGATCRGAACRGAAAALPRLGRTKAKCAIGAGRDRTATQHLMDHGIPWREQQAPSGYSRSSVWLMRQGLRLHWSGIRHPQTQGKVARFHGALQRAWRRRGIPAHHTCRLGSMNIVGNTTTCGPMKPWI